MSLLHICAADGCTTKTLGQFCVEHEQRAADPTADAPLLRDAGRVSGPGDDERELVVAGVA